MQSQLAHFNRSFLCDCQRSHEYVRTFSTFIVTANAVTLSALSSHFFVRLPTQSYFVRNVRQKMTTAKAVTLFATGIVRD